MYAKEAKYSSSSGRSLSLRTPLLGGATAVVGELGLEVAVGRGAEDLVEGSLKSARGEVIEALLDLLIGEASVATLQQIGYAFEDVEDDLRLLDLPDPGVAADAETRIGGGVVGARNGAGQGE